MALMDCRAIWWLELLRKTTRTENHGSRMEAVLSYPRRVHHGKTTSLNPVAPCGEGRREAAGWGERTAVRENLFAEPAPPPTGLRPATLPTRGRDKEAATSLRFQP